MKKFFIFALAALLLSIQTAKAQSNDNQGNLITFIYINGSNDYNAKNRLKFKDSFENDVKKMHPVMTAEFSEDATVNKLLLKDGKYRINPEPIVFYWGDKSLVEVQNIDAGLSVAKAFSPKIAQAVRGVFAHCLHDAIWIQKYQNMSPVIDELQSVVKSETDKGNKVVLMGYSAGSFITYQYFLNKFTSINPNIMINQSTNKEIAAFAKNYNVKPTCLDALMDAEIVTLNAYGKFGENSDKNKIFTNYPKLDSFTDNVCFKNDEVKGVINFASPFILFYSDVADSQTSLNYLSQLMFKNIIENDIFFLTVNYRNDPLGYPVPKNITMKDIKELDSVLSSQIQPGGGFVYTKSDVYVPRTFISAHMAYWDTPKRFVKGVLKAYKHGFERFYDVSAENM